MNENLLDKIKAYGATIITISNMEDVHKLGYSSFDNLIADLKKYEDSKDIKVEISSFTDSLASPLLSDDIVETINSKDKLKNDINDFKAVTIEIL